MRGTFPIKTAAFPHATLGKPQADGYSVREPDAIERTQVIDGAPRFRLMSPTRPFEFSLVFKWAGPQFDAFQDWYHRTLRNGSRWASMTLSLGAGDWTMAVHGRSRYQATRRGRLWTVQWDVEAFPNDENWPMPWQVEIIDSHTAYSPSLDKILAGTAGDPSSGIKDGGTAN